MRPCVQIANVYCACFCLMLVISGLFTHSEPLASYQFLSGNSQYVKYQIMVLFVFALYLVLMILNALSNAMWWPNVAGPYVSMLNSSHLEVKSNGIWDDWFYVEL